MRESVKAGHPFPNDVIDALAAYLARVVAHSAQCHIIDVMAHPHALRILSSLAAHREHGDAARLRDELFGGRT